MISLLALPKPFVGHIGVIQRNALNSWARLEGCEILLFGDEPGAAEMAAELSCRHVSEIERNQYGTPLVSSLFERGQQLARFDCVCYVNSDIVLLDDFSAAVRRVMRLKEQFLLIGRRWDLDFAQPLTFAPDWQAELRGLARRSGRLHSALGIDYFAFSRGLYRDVPPFALGRFAWDGWLVWKACQSAARVVDGTAAVTAIHQNHDYAHIPLAPPRSVTPADIFRSPEGQENLRLLGGTRHNYTIDNAPWRLTADLRLLPARGPRNYLAKLRRYPRLFDTLKRPVQISLAAWDSSCRWMRGPR